MESLDFVLGGMPVTRIVGRDENGETLYPLCGVAENLGYACVYADGSWQLTREDGTEIALMTNGETGLCDGAMGAYDGVVFLAIDQSRVYAYGGEAYVTAPLLEQLGFTVEEENGTVAISLAPQEI